MYLLTIAAILAKILECVSVGLTLMRRVLPYFSISSAIKQGELPKVLLKPLHLWFVLVRWFRI